VPLLFVLLTSNALAQNTSVVNSPHNLSASGPGAIRATSEQEICIFCHTPHNSSPIQPLWNRNVPVSAYTVYSSNSLQAKPGQPTGDSKLCLSCHDGTIAVGSVLSRSQPIEMSGGITTLPQGHGNLGTDLSDDHPISFRYDEALVTRNTKLKAPAAFRDKTSAIKIDANSELQCTSCHDPHDDSKGAFLVMDNTHSQLCTSCHNEGITTVAAHQECATCHISHTAPSGPYLLKAATVTETCNTCHGNTVSQQQGLNIAMDIAKFSTHDTNPPVNQPNNGTQVSCSDCHEPHTMSTGLASAPVISPQLGSVSGVNLAGAPVPHAQYNYETCFKCHAEQNTIQPFITRRIVSNNTRLQFAPSAISYHPITAPGKNMDVPSLIPGMTTATVIYCVDCHGSDTSKLAGGAGPNGPHGSNNKPLLIATYETVDHTSESELAYALCYRCHQRSTILASQTFPQHATHVVNDQTPCSVCHDAHGIPSAQGTAMNNSALINFDMTVVSPDPATGKLEYDRLGPRSGQCFLTCHNVPHSGLMYPGTSPLSPIVPQSLRHGTPTPMGPVPRAPAGPVGPAVPSHKGRSVR
jgi:predicted CXXCH cytochrome family protein